MRILWTLLFLLIPVLGVVVFVLAGLAPGAWLPEGVSTIGEDIDFLFYLILAITGFFFVVTEVLLVYAMFTARGQPDGKAAFIHGNYTLEIGWTVMTAIILVFVAFYQIPVWARAKMDQPEKEPDALVTASQFLWQVRYPMWDAATNRPKPLNTKNPSLAESFELVNEMHVPANEKVLVHLTTRDVIHSFWIPAARVKQDALPGHIIPVWFDLNKPGEYEFVCAELCGWGHYRMRAKVVVHPSREDYERWLQAKTAEVIQGAQKSGSGAGR